MFKSGSNSPQVTRTLISSITNLVLELPHELPNNLRLTILGNQELLEKFQIWVQRSQFLVFSSQFSFRKYYLAIAVKKYAKVDINVF